MLILAAGMIVLGALLAVMGIKIFKIALPILGLIVGVMVGFSGVQAVFGKGAVSVTIAIITGLLVGLLFAILSFFYFQVVVVVMSAVICASAMVMLAAAFGLSNDGFLTFLMGFAGAVLGIVLATATPLGIGLIMTFSAFFGTALVYAGIMLLIGKITVDELDSQGVIQTVLNNVNNLFVWLIVWFGSSVAAIYAQTAILEKDFLENKYAYIEE